MTGFPVHALFAEFGVGALAASFAHTLPLLTHLSTGFAQVPEELRHIASPLST